MILLTILIALIVWTLASILYFVVNLGNKNKPAPWYEWLILLPTIPIAAITGLFIKFVKRK